MSVGCGWEFILFSFQLGVPLAFLFPVSLLPVGDGDGTFGYVSLKIQDI